MTNVLSCVSVNKMSIISATPRICSDQFRAEHLASVFQHHSCGTFAFVFFPISSSQAHYVDYIYNFCSTSTVAQKTKTDEQISCVLRFRYFLSNIQICAMKQCTFIKNIYEAFWKETKMSSGMNYSPHCRHSLYSTLACMALNLSKAPFHGAASIFQLTHFYRHIQLLRTCQYQPWLPVTFESFFFFLS